MRFRIGPPPDSKDFSPEREGWQALHEPGPLLFHVVTLPVAALVVFTLILMIRLFTPIRLPGIPAAIRSLPIPVVFLLFVLMTHLLLLPFTAAHEGLHLVGYPRHERSSRVILGMWPRGLLAYVHYEGPLSRTRVLLISATPFVALSLLPLLLAAVFDLRWWGIGGMVLLNGAASVGDLVNMLFLLQIPGRAWIQYHGWRTYWKAMPLRIPVEEGMAAERPGRGLPQGRPQAGLPLPRAATSTGYDPVASRRARPGDSKRSETSRKPFQTGIAGLRTSPAARYHRIRIIPLGRSALDPVYFIPSVLEWPPIPCVVGTLPWNS